MGFFTRRSSAEMRKSRRSGRAQKRSLETVRALGPAAVRGMNPKARHPEMEPAGAEHARVYFLGAAPGKVEDLRGVPFSGREGEALREAIGVRDYKASRFDYVCRTRPIGDAPPSAIEVEAFRSSVEASIAECRPRVVVGFGVTPLKWLAGLNAIKAFRGKPFVANIGGHPCWYLPTLDVAFLDKIEGERADKVPHDQWLAFWNRDLRRAFELAEGGSVPETVSEEEARAGVELCLTLESVRDALREIRELDHVGFDVENTPLRPHGPKARLLSLAFSDGDRSWAIPYDHPGHKWGEDFDALHAMLVDAFDGNGPRFVAHNAMHDVEWTVVKLRRDVLERQRFDCSQNAAYVLDPGPPGENSTAGHGLNDLCKREFGLDLKAMTPRAEFVTRLVEFPVEEVLTYNALDAKWCLRLWQTLMIRVLEQDQLESYERQIDRIAFCIEAQVVGVPVDAEVNAQLAKKYGTRLETLERELAATDVIKNWSENNGRALSPASNADVLKLCRSEGIKVKNVDAGALGPHRKDHPWIDTLLKYRGASKLFGTYVKNFERGVPGGYVHDDGLIHCSFTIARTRSFRLASEDPNNQNWPKRKNREVRGQLTAGDGHTLIAADQGQVEARVIAMESCDPTWVRSIQLGLDVHQDWAIKIAEIDPRFRDLLESDPKAARHMSKNGWVFPAFFGSSIHSIVDNVKLEDADAAEDLFAYFWEEFAGVKAWQRRTWKKYEMDGYVTSLTGRRRLGPLSWNMVINTPVQGCASDICVDAGKRLNRRAVDEGKPWLSPVLQIHDDLTLRVPDEHVEDAVVAVVEEQLGFDAPWVNVPLSVEVEVGPNLFDMEAIGTWTSDQL